MPDDPQRYDHERLFETLLIRWLNDAIIEILGLLQAGYSIESMPPKFWEGLQENLVRKIEPHVQLVQYRASERLLKEIGLTISPTIRMLDATRSASDMAIQAAESQMQTVLKVTSNLLKASEERDLSIAALIVMLLNSQENPVPMDREDPRNIKDRAIKNAGSRDSVTLTTASITAGERITADRINEAIRNRQIDIDDGLGELESPVTIVDRLSTKPAGSGVDDVKPALLLVPYWVTEKDEKVCPICSPLDGKSSKEWPKELQSGPPAHPKCRCKITWRFAGRDLQN